jgi:hypothetical protein
VAAQCLRRAELTRRLRLLGVKVSSLARVETVEAGRAAAAASPSMPELPLF